MPRRFDVAGLRDRMGLSQPQFADRVGVDTRTVRRWELAETDPSPAAIKLLQQVKDSHEQSDTQSDASDEPKKLTGPRRVAAVLPSLP